MIRKSKKNLREKKKSQRKKKVSEKNEQRDESAIKTKLMPEQQAIC